MVQANPYPLRIAEDIMNAVRKSAEENGRSVNKEIEFILKQYLKKQGYLENPQSKD